MIEMAKKKNIPKDPVMKPALGYSPVQATASGAGVHEKTGKRRRRNDRRLTKQKLRQGDFD